MSAPPDRSPHAPAAKAPALADKRAQDLRVPGDQPSSRDRQRLSTPDEPQTPSPTHRKYGGVTTRFRERFSAQRLGTPPPGRSLLLPPSVHHLLVSTPGEALPPKCPLDRPRTESPFPANPLPGEIHSPSPVPVHATTAKLSRAGIPACSPSLNTPSRLQPRHSGSPPIRPASERDFHHPAKPEAPHAHPS